MGTVRHDVLDPTFMPPRAAACRGSRRGFTLVELLTVVAILVVLVGMLMPTLFRAIRFARLASCAANMHGIYTALVVYAGDNKNFVPTVGAYTRDGGGWCGLGLHNGNAYWSGALARTRSYDNLQLLVCPGTQTWGGSDMQNSGLYKNIGTNANPTYALRPASDMDSLAGRMWSNYGLRWSGWWHKVYPGARLMMAEVVCSEQGDYPFFTEMDIHGGTFAGSGVNIGVEVVRVGEASMNIVGSDGRVVRLLNYADFSSWKWGKCLWGAHVIPDKAGVVVPSLTPYYYPCNDRTGDVWITGQKEHSDPFYEGQDHIADGSLRPWSDLPWDFWTTFDQEIFNGSMMPWGNSDVWWPDTWQNP